MAGECTHVPLVGYRNERERAPSLHSLRIFAYFISYIYHARHKCKHHTGSLKLQTLLHVQPLHNHTESDNCALQGGDTHTEQETQVCLSA